MGAHAHDRVWWTPYRTPKGDKVAIGTTETGDGSLRFREFQYYAFDGVKGMTSDGPLYVTFQDAREAIDAKYRKPKTSVLA